MFGATRRSPRLAQWDGRTRSSRSDAIDWRRLLRRGVITRLVFVILTAGLLTAVVAGDGPPFPYRLGQTAPRDVRSRVSFEAVDEPATVRARDFAEHQQPAGVSLTSPTLPIIDRYPAGLVLVKRDEPISPEQLVVLQSEHSAFVASLPRGRAIARTTALAAIIALLVSTVVVYSTRFQHALAKSTGRVTGVCVLVAVTFVLAVALNRPPWHAAAVPLVITAMVLTIAYNPPFALFMSLCLALLLALSQGTDLSPFLVHLGGLATTVLAIRRVRTRTRPAEVGLIAGVALALMTAATDVLSAQTPGFTATDAGRNLLCGLLAGCVLTGCLPLIEKAFGVVSDVSLIELADSSHPLLEELLRRAPGTYTHSMTVATLAESAADAIRANTLLTRVGCYYHDIGKMLKPHYFIENQNGPNVHDQLEPTLSTLIIVGHVKDGAALAEQYRLPRPIADLILEHHGTTLVEYFYREALKLHSGVAPDALEAGFRYPGPKPQSREACILMLADAAESASRALPSPNPTNLRKLVNDLAIKRLLDGQFDESGLTLSELRTIADAITKGLIAVYHARIRYTSDDPLAKPA
jgi:cyclic-di-AMP phosphodiesterase PgpH